MKKKVKNLNQPTIANDRKSVAFFDINSIYILIKLFKLFYNNELYIKTAMTVVISRKI